MKITTELFKARFKQVNDNAGNINEIYQKGKRWVNLSTYETGLIGEKKSVRVLSCLAPAYIQKMFN